MLSVIVPAYNIAEWLGECVESILAQTWRDYELIIVNDGSTDATASVADRYASEDERIRVIHKENRGLGEARNTGLCEAHGEYVMFIDGDDLVHPEMFMALMRCVEKTGAPIASCGIAKFFDEDELQRARSSATRQLHLCKDISRLYSRQAPVKTVEKMLYQTGWVTNSPCGKVFDISLFKDNKFPDGLYEDLAVIPQIYLETADKFPGRKVVHVPLDFYYYRQRPGSIIQTWSSKRLDVLKVTDMLCQTLPENLKKAADDRHLSACFNMFLLLQSEMSGKPEMSRKSELAEAAKNCWNEIRRLRMRSLINPRVRFKNKAGIIASFFGRNFLSLLK